MDIVQLLTEMLNQTHCSAVWWLSLSCRFLGSTCVCASGDVSSFRGSMVLPLKQIVERAEVEMDEEGVESRA